jgi:hypothetical protein
MGENEPVIARRAIANTVIASQRVGAKRRPVEAKQSMEPHKERKNGLLRSARNDVETHESAISRRDAPEVYY